MHDLDLQLHLESLYALQKITAKDLCIACYWCDEAVILGADFSPMALPPDLQSGKYQDHIDKVAPPSSHLDHIQVASMSRGTESRSSVTTTVALVHEALEAEVRESPDIMQKVATTQWPTAYYEHPMVKSALRQGTQLPLPVFMYTEHQYSRLYTRFIVGSVVPEWCQQ